MSNKNKKVMAIVLAGGEGKRLMPLTTLRAKPAVPFGGKYRLIDFPLSNLINSNILRIIVLTQYKSHSLHKHISKVWNLSGLLLGNYITPIPAQQRTGKNWYLGSADAIYQNFNLIIDENPDIIVVLGADHVYKMDIDALVNSHIASKKSLTVCGIRQPLKLASEFGVIEGANGLIKSFIEKPSNPKPLKEDPEVVLASMGNYVFNCDSLMDALEKDANNDASKHDMGGDIVPFFVNQNDAAYYDFINNHITGEHPKNEHYWRDVGTLDSYYEANMDLVDINPQFDLYNKKWPLYGSGNPTEPPAKFVDSTGGNQNVLKKGFATNSYISNGTIISGADVYHSVISSNCILHYGSFVSSSVLMDNVTVGKNSSIKNAVIDKNVKVGENIKIGYNLEDDKKRGFVITTKGIVVIKKGTVIKE
jgi:glucose-1-phosphate adenylyltransferase